MYYSLMFKYVMRFLTHKPLVCSVLFSRVLYHMLFCEPWCFSFVFSQFDLAPLSIPFFSWHYYHYYYYYFSSNLLLLLLLLFSITTVVVVIIVVISKTSKTCMKSSKSYIVI